MREEKFKVIQFIRKLILEVDKELENFPKKDLEIKNRLRTSSYDLLELAYEANSTKNLEFKQELLTRMIAKIKIMDFLLNLSYDKNLLTERKYLKLAKIIDDIAKYTNGWQKNIVGQS
ncbi:MAG: four helix bundle protein [Clostridia bacterium]|nr:four helix bundle protein [Clostridia bacterium]